MSRKNKVLKLIQFILIAVLLFSNFMCGDVYAIDLPDMSPKVTITQQPTKSNDYTVLIEINSLTQIKGYQWYTTTINEEGNIIADAKITGQTSNKLNTNGLAGGKYICGIEYSNLTGAGIMNLIKYSNPVDYISTTMNEIVSEYSGTYDGSAHGISITNIPSDSTILYGTTEGTYNLTENPTLINVGTKTIYYKITSNYCEEIATGKGTITITKATPEIVKPTPIDGIYYTGDEYILINPGSTNFGTMIYSLDGINWSTAIPTGIEAKTYTIYYKVEGTENYNEIPTESITVNIKKIAADGKDGITPQIRINSQSNEWEVSMDEGITWYSTGVKATGKDGISPKVQINVKTGELEVSYNNGKNWTSLGKVVGTDGKDGANGKDGKNGVDGKDGINGKDGKDGVNGKDGVDGTKGEDGITPQIQINKETKELQVSYDGGRTWTSLGVKLNNDEDMDNNAKFEYGLREYMIIGILGLLSITANLLHFRKKK